MKATDEQIAVVDVDDCPKLEAVNIALERVHQAETDAEMFDPLCDLFDAGYESAREKWTATKPDYACVFVGKRGNDYSLWNFAWIQGEAPEDFKGDEDTLHYCLAWTNADGDEWDDYEECEFDQYLVIAKLPTMDDIHTETVERIKKRYEREQGGE